MSIAWIAPAALFGLALVILPIAVHLLVRQQARVLAFPSLRFLRETQLAAFRRRTIQDALLLLCRAAIIALAALALAGPVLQSSMRQAEYARRVSRAIITLDGVDRGLLERAAEGAFASRTVFSLSMADALAESERWLNQQPPSAREILILGALRRGALDDAVLSLVDREIGIRFQPVAVETTSTPIVPVLTRRDAALVIIDRRVRAAVDATHVTDGPSTPAPPDLVRIIASPDDTALAEAALGAALEAGVPWANLNQHVVIAWDGADTSALNANTRLIRMPVPSLPAAAADAVREVLLGVSRPRLKEPVLAGAEQLAAWTRPPGRPSPDAPVTDEGDRRWLWAAALVLLIIEWRLRRSTAREADHTAEARVA